MCLTDDFTGGEIPSPSSIIKDTNALWLRGFPYIDFCFYWSLHSRFNTQAAIKAASLIRERAERLKLRG